MNESLSAHGAIIGLCLLVILGLSLSHVEVLCIRTKTFLQRIWSEWSEYTGW